jgi:hypothetical protein
MQKTKVNFDTVYEFETLYNAYRASRRGKRWKNTVAKVEMNALEAIAVLQEELSTGTYRPGGYREFMSSSRRKGSFRPTPSRTKSSNTPFATPFSTTSSPVLSFSTTTARR